MAVTGTHFDVKIFVDKEKGRVLFAEADGNFVDVLFSFLTLPLGTIVRLIGKKQSKPATMGCFDSFYRSVTSLGNEHFYAKGFKDMLLHPRSSSELYCRRLKVNIDDTEAKYFLCPNHKTKHRTTSGFMSIYSNTNCPTCWRTPMSTVREYGAFTRYSSKAKAFVTKASKFIITDDLQVMPFVPETMVGLFNDLGINDMSVIEERAVELGLNELLVLLKRIFLSTTPLTDLFLSEKEQPCSSAPKKLSLPKKSHCADASGEDRKMDVKVVLNKSSKEFLYVEAGKDFMDFLFSLLLIPLGQVLHIMQGQSCAGCIDGLYKSALSLDSQYFISEDKRDVLLRPKLAPILNHMNHLFPLESTDISCVIHGFTRTMPVDIKLAGAGASGGFVRKDEAFFVLDNLEVTPFSAASAISIFSTHKISVSDLEKRTVRIGAAEGISILRASLNSTSAISNGLLHNSPIFKEPKQETTSAISNGLLRNSPIFKEPKQEK